jgi:hypothetical protein
MRGILEFDLPQDAAEMRYAQAGLDALLVLNDFDQECRSRLKHGAGAFADLDENTIEHVRGWLAGASLRRNLPELE